MSNFSCGFVALVGRPNVGKSTLVNRLVKFKVSATSSKVQTTRQCVQGILTKEDAQYIFCDTPGFCRQYSGGLNNFMQETLQRSLRSVDILVFVVEAGNYTDEDRQLAKCIPGEIPVILLVNKIDVLKKSVILSEFIKQVQLETGWTTCISLSGKYEADFSILLQAIKVHLPIHPALYPYEDKTNQRPEFLVSECIREKVYRMLGDELPYYTAVALDECTKTLTCWRVEARVFVAQLSHKGMVIGKNGDMLKKISIAARVDLEKWWGCKVYIRIKVVHRDNWSNDDQILKQLGYVLTA